MSAPVKGKRIMLKNSKFISALAALILTFSAAPSFPVRAAGPEGREARRAESRVQTPINLAVLVQDDLVARVGNEIDATRDFIRALPVGSRVMIGYLTAGSLQVRQQFTADLDRAARSLRIPRASESAAPYNPYVGVVEALRTFEGEGAVIRNVVLLISDGRDVSRGFDASSTLHSVDLQRAVREAKRRNIAVFTFYSPSVGLTSFNHTAMTYGQGALNRLASETGGRAFFQGSSYVTFDSYFRNLSRAINEQYAAAE